MTKTMAATQVAETLIQSAAEFLAQKHGVTVAQIADALEAGNERVAGQMAELMQAACEATGVTVTA